MAPEVSPRRARAVLVTLSLAAFAFITTELMPVGLLTHIAPDLRPVPLTGGSAGQRVRSGGGAGVRAADPADPAGPPPAAARRHDAPVRRRDAAAALAPAYAMLAGARLVIALTQALFWSIVTSTAIGPFPVAVRGRAVALFAIGATLAPVLGVPLGTWLGQQAGVARGVRGDGRVGVAIAAAVLACCRPPSAGPPAAARGSRTGRAAVSPCSDRHRPRRGGVMTAQTYVTPFLLDVSGFADAVLGPLLLVSGAAGVVGTLVAARTLDTRPSLRCWRRWPSAGSLLGLYRSARSGRIVVRPGRDRPRVRGVRLGRAEPDAATGRAGQHRHGVGRGQHLLQRGIAGGSLLGGALLPTSGARPLALAGGLLTLAALTLLAVDSRRGRAVGPEPTVARPPATRRPDSPAVGKPSGTRQV